MIRIALSLTLGFGLAGCSFTGLAGDRGDDAGAGTDAPTASADAGIDADSGRWGTPQALGLEPLGSDGSYDDPSITDDGLEIYFAASAPDVPEDIYVATRANTNASFGTATKVDELSSDGADATPVISGDGLVAVIGRSVGPNDVDLFISVRADRQSAFPTPTAIPEATDLAINGPDVEGSGFITADRLTLIFASNRDGSLDLYQATRASDTDPFDNVTKLPLSDPLENEISPSLTADGLGLYYSVFGGGRPSLDIFYTQRASTSDDFPAGTPVAELNSVFSDSDMREAAGGHLGVLASDRDDVNGNDRLYLVER